MITEKWKKLPANLRSSVTSRTASRLRKEPTHAESVFMGKLLDAGFLKYRFQQIFHSDDFVMYADFYIRKPFKMVIEIDGGYHLTQEQQERDREKDWYYITNPVVKSVLRMNNEQAINITVPELKKLIYGLHTGSVTILYELPKY